MKKPNWTRFVSNLYCWKVRYDGPTCFSCYVEKLNGKSRGVNIRGDQVLTRIYEMNFSQIKEARDLIRRSNGKYKLCCEKRI